MKHTYYPLACACCGIREDICDCVYLREGGCTTHPVVHCREHSRYDAYGVERTCPKCVGVIQRAVPA